MNSPRLMDQVRDVLRVHHYSLRTEQSYLQWIRRFILFHGKRHPREMGADEIAAFLTYLAVKKDVAASTQNQALSAVLGDAADGGCAPSITDRSPSAAARVIRIVSPCCPRN